MSYASCIDGRKTPSDLSNFPPVRRSTREKVDYRFPDAGMPVKEIVRRGLVRGEIPVSRTDSLQW